MAGSLLRPPLKLNPLTKQYNSSNSSSNSSINSSLNIKSIIKKQPQLQQQQQQNQKQYLLSLQGKHNSSCHRSHQGYPEQLKHLNYCHQSLLFKELLLLLFLFLVSENSFWTAIEYKNNCNNLAAAVAELNILQYEQQKQQQQQQHKLYLSTKKFCKKLLNRKKFQLKLQQQLQLQLQLQRQRQLQRQHQLQLKSAAKVKDKIFYRKNLLLEKVF